MYASFFTYNITKPYPFRWFTPTVIIGAIVFSALFSVLNLAANGYELRTIYTTDPNATLHQSYWFSTAPWSWTSRIVPTCQSIGIPLGSQVFTSNLGMQYILSAVSRHDQGSNRSVRYPSLPYLNQTLQDCQVDHVQLDFRKDDDSVPHENSSWWSWGSTTGSAAITCVVGAPDGLLNATFTSTYNTGLASYDYILQLNATTDASLWWGSRLLNLYFASILQSVYLLNFPDYLDGPYTDDPAWSKGKMTWQRNETSTDIRSDDYFQITWSFNAANGRLFNPAATNGQLYNNLTNAQFSQTFTQSLAWARAMYSFALVDFGQPSGQNVLLDVPRLQYMLQHPDDVFRNDPNNPLHCANGSCAFIDFARDINLLAAPDAADPVNDRNTVMNETYDAFRDQMGPLGTHNATIFSNYACQVPRLKAPGTVVVTVILADLVFLQACWVILKWIADMLVQRSDNAAQKCVGCCDHIFGPASSSGAAVAAALPRMRGYSALSDGREQIQDNVLDDEVAGLKAGFKVEESYPLVEQRSRLFIANPS